jgi:transcriptional regulator with XRE-family HTH domain
VASSDSSSANTNSVFGKRLKEARLRLEIPQDKLGVMIGLDEHTASARMSRYENGIHEPQIKIARLIAKSLNVPLAYLYCDDEKLAQIVLSAHKLSSVAKDKLIQELNKNFST